MTPAAYDAVAAAYEQRIVPYFRPLAEAVVEAGAVRSGDRVLDLGAGTGGAARLAAQCAGSAGHVTLIDVAAAMLTEADRVMTAAGLGNHLSVVGDLKALPFIDGQFDVVLSQFSNVLEGSPEAMAEAHRVLLPGGRLALAMWDPTSEDAEDAILAAARDAVGFAPTAAPVARTLTETVGALRSAGFASVQVTPMRVPQRYPSAEDYAAYRDGFPWRSLVTDAAQQSRYLEALRDEASKLAAPDGSVTITWAVAVISATRP